MHHLQHSGVLGEVGHGVLEESQADQHDAEADNEFADGPCLVAFHKQQWGCQGKDDEGECVIGCAHAHAEQDNPGGDGGADIGPHNHGDGACQGEEAGVDKTDHHDSGCCR